MKEGEREERKSEGGKGVDEQEWKEREMTEREGREGGEEEGRRE